MIEVILSAVSAGEIETLLAAFRATPKRLSAGGYVRSARVPLREVWDGVEPVLARIAGPLIGPLGPSRKGMIVRTESPFKIHTDGPTAGPNNLSLLIPLAVEPAGAATATVFFAQRSDLDGTVFRKGSPAPPAMSTLYEYKDEHAVRASSRRVFTEDYASVEGLVADPFPRADYDAWLTHLDYENREGLWLDRVVSWEIGAAIAFPSRRLHCSAQFAGLTAKTYLLYATDKDRL